jgi:hypothetical protein
MARRAWCNRVHSAVTRKVCAIEEAKVNVHAAFLKFASGQLLFLGLWFPIALRPTLRPRVARMGRVWLSFWRPFLGLLPALFLLMLRALAR